MITYILIYIALVAFGFAMAKFCEEPSMFWVSLVPVLNIGLVVVLLFAIIDTLVTCLNDWFKGQK